MPVSTALGFLLSALLIAVADTLSDRRLESIPSAVQQRDLAVLAALRHESVCREIAGFARRGVVERGPHGISISDRAALEAA